MAVEEEWMNCRTNRPEGDIRRRVGQRGSALVLVLLILLALSAIGMVALKNVTGSLNQSGQFRARSNAQALADAATRFMGTRFGNNPKRILQAMEQAQDLEREGSISRTSGKYSGSSAAIERRGKFLNLEQKPGETTDFDDVLTSSTAGDLQETGLLYDGTHPSFESKEGGAQFEVIIRDTLSGFPAPGSGDEYCLTRVIIAARGEVGPRDSDWTEPRQTGVGTGIFEAMVGPTDVGCESSG
jgi:hypothetical protein